MRHPVASGPWKAGIAPAGLRHLLSAWQGAATPAGSLARLPGAHCKPALSDLSPDAGKVPAWDRMPVCHLQGLVGAWSDTSEPVLMCN